MLLHTECALVWWTTHLASHDLAIGELHRLESAHNSVTLGLIQVAESRHSSQHTQAKLLVDNLVQGAKQLSEGLAVQLIAYNLG